MKNFQKNRILPRIVGVMMFFIIIHNISYSQYRPAQTLNSKQVKIHGRLGERYKANIKYLQSIYTDYKDFMLDPYRYRGKHEKRMCYEGYMGKYPKRPWDGEYAGKWLDAASKTAANTSDELLLKQINSILRALIHFQEPDGYIGIEDNKTKGKASWASWDTWLRSREPPTSTTAWFVSGVSLSMRTTLSSWVPPSGMG